MSERLWAPWRMQYMLAPKGGGCIFCEFSASSPATFREKLILLVAPLALVVLNRYPFAGSHLMVAPRRHVADFADLPEGEYDEMMRLIRASVARLRAATGAEGINVGFNLGRAAGAGIADHMHAHAVPRWTGDSNFMPVVADVRIMPEYLDASWARLAPHFADLPGLHPAD